MYTALQSSLGEVELNCADIYVQKHLAFDICCIDSRSGIAGRHHTTDFAGRHFGWMTSPGCYLVWVRVLLHFVVVVGDAGGVKTEFPANVLETHP